jgi:hypothetical protein
MRIGLKDIDPDIAARLIERVKAAADKFNAKEEMTEAERQAYEVIKARLAALNVRGGCTFFLTLLFAPAVYWFVSRDLHVLFGMAAGLATLYSGMVWALQADLNKQMRKEVSPEEIRAGLTLLELTPTERLYGESILLLLNAADNLDAEHTKDVLRQLNEMMRRSRRVDERIISIRQAVQSADLAKSEAERAELAAQMEASQDDAVRENLRSRLELIDGSLRDGHDLVASLDRMETERELVDQTLASMNSALTRALAAPDVSFTHEVEEITSTAARINAQARAEEQAVQEVEATLRVE